jgi:aspartate/methionine/tyrosine aminotransferase
MRGMVNKAGRIDNSAKGRAAYSDRIHWLVDSYNKMNETGEPFGTGVIADMGKELAAEGDDIIFCAESVLTSAAPVEIVRNTVDLLPEYASKQEAPFLGLPELRKAISRRFDLLYNVHFNWEDEIIVTSGSMQAEYFVMGALLNAGDEVIIPTPAYFFDIPARMFGGKPVFVDMKKEDGFRINRQMLEDSVSGRTKMLVICNPHNPTGHVLDQEEINEIVEFVAKNEIYLLYDQVYDRIVYGDKPFIAISQYKEIKDFVITAGSFSKIYNMINYRLGYALGNRALIKGLEVQMAFSSMGIPNFVQAGAARALESDFEEMHVRKVNSDLKRYVDYAALKFSDLMDYSIIKPEGANLVLLDIRKSGLGSMDFCKDLLKVAKVAAAPGIAYHAEGYIRISLGGKRSIEAIDRIHDYISSKYN